tara:strand:+ start:508 stop:804 length:297 start_codon:yes stop_codon:yes gene_type:complete
MRTGKVQTYKCLYTDIIIPLLNLPMLSSMVVCGVWFLLFFLFTVFIGIIVGSIISVIASGYVWSFLYVRYKRDKHLSQIRTQNLQRKQPYQKKRKYYA